MSGRPDRPIRNTPSDASPDIATKDQLPSAVTTTPNGLPGADSIAVGTLVSSGADAVAVLHPGTRAGTIARAGAVWAGDALRPAAGCVPAEQAATAATA